MYYYLRRTTSNGVKLISRFFKQCFKVTFSILERFLSASWANGFWRIHENSWNNCSKLVYFYLWKTTSNGLKLISRFFKQCFKITFSILVRFLNASWANGTWRIYKKSLNDCSKLVYYNLRITTSNGFKLISRFFKQCFKVTFSILERFLNASWANGIWRIHKKSLNNCSKLVYYYLWITTSNGLKLISRFFKQCFKVTFSILSSHFKRELN